MPVSQIGYQMRSEIEVTSTTRVAQQHHVEVALRAELRPPVAPDRDERSALHVGAGRALEQRCEPVVDERAVTLAPTRTRERAVGQERSPFQLHRTTVRDGEPVTVRRQMTVRRVFRWLYNSHTDGKPAVSMLHRCLHD